MDTVHTLGFGLTACSAVTPLTEVQSQTQSRILRPDSGSGKYEEWAGCCLRRDRVEKRRWIGKKDFLDGVALGQTMPGPLAQMPGGSRAGGTWQSAAGVLLEG